MLSLKTADEWTKPLEMLAAEIIEDLQTALDEMSLIYADLAAKAG